MAPVPRRDSVEHRGRASTNASANGEMAPPTQPAGLDRVLDSLKLENSELRKSVRELDDRCTCIPLPSLVSTTFLYSLLLVMSVSNSGSRSL